MSWSQRLMTLEGEFNELSKAHNAVTFKNECEYALQAIHKKSRLAECVPMSVQDSVKNVASIGLTLNPAYGYAYLVPDSIKSGNQWIKVCQLRISFTGFVKLATDSGAIKLCNADIVRENDTFEYFGKFKEPVHKVANIFDLAKRGKEVGVYCVAFTHEDKPIVDYMSWDEVQQIKAAAKTQTVWNNWEGEMAKKAMIKRAQKQWPKTAKNDQFAKAVQYAHETEGSSDEGYSVEEKQKLDTYLNESPEIDFFGFVNYMEDTKVQALFNSFEDGEKVGSKEKWKEKRRKGLDDVRQRSAMLESDDEETREQATEGLTAVGIKVLERFHKDRTQSK